MGNSLNKWINKDELEELSKLKAKLISIRSENSEVADLILSSNASNEKKKKILLREIEKENEIESEKNARENEKRLRIEAKNAKENEKRLRIEEGGIEFLISNGLPPLPKCNVSHSKPSYGKHPFILDSVKHVGDVAIGIPSCCKISNFPKLPSQIWKRTSTQDNGVRILGDWNNEAGIEKFVRTVLTDIVALLNLQNKINLSCQIKITLLEHLIPDILLMEVHGRLIGICEVKQPSYGNLTKLNSNHRDQISNYLLQLKNLYGVRTPICIISTYNEWMICSLSESYDCVTSSEETFIQPTESKAPQAEGKETILFTSKVFPYNSKELVEVLASAIYKIYHSIIDPPINLLRSKNLENCSEPRKFGFVNNNGFKWTVLPPKLTSLTYEMPKKGTNNFFFIQDFHGGKDGRVWLVTSKLGNVAVCKLSEIRKYKDEAGFWNEIWGPEIEAYTTTLLNARALIMPFVFHAHIIENGQIIFRPFGNKWSSCESTINDICRSEIPGKFDPSLEHYYNQPRLVAEKALRDMADNGYIHGDLKWRHVGLLPFKKYDTENDRTELDDSNLNDNFKWAVKPVLIDLHDTQSIPPGYSKEDAVMESLEILENELKTISS